MCVSNLISRAALREGVQLVHLPDVLPQVCQVGWEVEVHEEPPRHPDVLQLGHQLRVEAAEGVAGQEPTVVWKCIYQYRYIILTISAAK